MESVAIMLLHLELNDGLVTVKVFVDTRKQFHLY